MLPGEVHAQPRRCGKSNCRCARGELHPAYHRFWTEEGRQRKEYVWRADLEETRAACIRWKEADAAKAALLSSPEADEIRRQVRATLRSALGVQAGTATGRRQLRRRRP
ncbi:MAG: DUF6788 family protein [Pyrinomonadaceae bacterium]